jgi:ribonucleotide monophosphatase NagD (HAD superfamily)
MHSEEAVMISDNWHTDIIMSLQSGLETVLMFSWLTWRDNIEPYSYGTIHPVELGAEIVP